MADWPTIRHQVAAGGDYYHEPMSDEPAAVALRCGPLRLMFSSEEGITAAEVVTTGDQTRLDIEDVRGVAHQLDRRGGGPVRPDILFIIDSHADAFPDPLAAGVTVEIYGPDDTDATVHIGNLNPEVQKGMLTEAAFAAWGQSIADAADSLDQLTSAEAAIIGRLRRFRTWFRRVAKTPRSSLADTPPHKAAT